MILLQIFSKENAYLFDEISAVATAIAVIIGLYTIIEVIKQRQSSYKPEIIILDDYFDVNTNNYSYLYINKNSENKNIEDSFLNNMNFNVKLINLGLGTAKNVKVKFEIDIMKYLKKFYSFYENKSNNMESFECELNRNSLYIVPPKYFGNKIHFNIDNPSKHKFNYILPVSILDNLTELKIPAYITYIHSIILHLGWKYQNLEKTDFEFNIEIQYEDIGGKKFEKKFKISFEIATIMKESSSLLLKVSQLK